MKQCIHPNCNQFLKDWELRLCKYHQKELQNNGKPGHWTCTWCSDYSGGFDTNAEFEAATGELT